MAFTERVRNIIRHRAGGKDELTGLPLVGKSDCSHLNHDKKSPEYNEPSNGILTTIWGHIWMHMLDEDNGLNERQNSWSVEHIRMRSDGYTKEDRETYGRWINFDDE